MIKWLNRLFCKHEKVRPAGTSLERQKDGIWKTVHKWQCKNCGKIIKGD